VTPPPLLLGIALGCGLITAVMTPVIRRLAVRVGLVDSPVTGAHKTHLSALPYGGGVAIYCGGSCGILGLIGLSLGDAFGSPASLWGIGVMEIVHVSEALALFLCASVVFFVGLVDDWIGLSPLLRLLAQIAAAAALVLGVPGFILPLAPSIPLVAPLATMLWIVAVTNAFNFLDNMDGLVAGMSVIAFASIGVIALWSPHFGGLVLSLSLAGASAGFLIFNFPRASIFMGDSGGLFLGFSAAGLTALLSRHLGEISAPPSPWPHLLAPLLILLVAAYDQLTVVALRLYKGNAPWLGDTNHVSHRLVRLGLSRRSAVLLIHGLVALSGALALWVLMLSPESAWKLLGASAAILILLGMLDWAAVRRRER